jgi:hypothetical protein
VLDKKCYSNIRAIGEWSVGKNLEGEGRGLIEVLGGISVEELRKTTDNLSVSAEIEEIPITNLYIYRYANPIVMF